MRHDFVVCYAAGIMANLPIHNICVCPVYPVHVHINILLLYTINRVEVYSYSCTRMLLDD